jgi:iturin family lipopeptide synthetase A
MRPIAIIGIGCRFPQATGPDGFWRLLTDGKDAISEIPADRWDIRQFYESNPSGPGKMSTRWGAFLDQVNAFDPDFFGIPAREAEQMDPQQRLILEVTWEALEDAGQAPRRLASTRCGVFIGASNSDFGLLQSRMPQAINAFTGTGCALSIIANRLSYCLDLRGPSMVIDTACSSSLVAVHLACQSLANEECYPIALAGGVNLILSPVGTIFLSKAGAMSTDGRTRTFDAQASGFARGEGAGVVVLKPLEDALRDHDFIYATIRGSAVNQDGRSNGLAAPNRWSQEAVLREAYKRAGVSPSKVQYIEVHGTGTPLGDTVEAAALGAVLSEERPPGARCAVGTVKTNFGHLESAAGIAGLIKVALMLRHRMIPPNLHFTKPNPYIDLAKSMLRVPVSLEPWLDDRRPVLAGVSAFGFGGTNAHVVLENAPARDSGHSEAERPIHLLTLSARSEPLLRALAGKFANYFVAQSTPALADICFSANTGRTQFSYRLAIQIRSHADAHQQLEAIRTGSEAAGSFTTPRHTRVAPKIAFLFPDQGCESPGMGWQLYNEQPTFRAALDQCLEICEKLPECSPRDYLFSGLEMPFSPASSHTALFALEYALAQMWLSCGVSANVSIGDGLGEYVAASVAGRIPLEDSLKFVALRQSSPPGRFAQSVQIAADQGCQIFMELGPGATLCRMLGTILGNAQECLLLPSLGSGRGLKDDEDWYTVLSNCAQLYLSGVMLDWTGFEPGYNQYKVPLPTSVFDHGS